MPVLMRGLPAAVPHGVKCSVGLYAPLVALGCFAAASCSESARPSPFAGDWVLDSEPADAGADSAPPGAPPNAPPLPPIEPVAEDEFLARADAESCAAADGCCNSLATWPSAINCDFWNVSRAASLPNTVYNPETAARCLQSVADFADRCTATPGGPEWCQRVYEGTLAPGEPCAESAECATEPGGRGFCDGVCTVQRPGVLRESCSYSCRPMPHGEACRSSNVQRASTVEDVECLYEDGLFCNRDGYCDTLPTLGQSCDDECGGDSRCVLGADGSACQPFARLDEPCRDLFDCDSGLYCEPETSSCQPQQEEGAPCDPTVQGECLGSCLDTDRCGAALTLAEGALALLCSIVHQ